MVQLLVAAEGKLLVKPIEENKGLEYSFLFERG
jgi:hypothetical protein